MNNFTVQFQGFSPSNFTRTYLDSKLMQLHQRAPIGSTLNAMFVRESGGIKATLRIMSKAGDFFAVARGFNLKDANRRLATQIQKQLKRWKHDSRMA